MPGGGFGTAYTAKHTQPHTKQKTTTPAFRSAALNGSARGASGYFRANPADLAQSQTETA